MAPLLHLFFALLVSTLTSVDPALGSSTGRPDLPYNAVILDNATIIGKANGTVVQYLGIPFAQPPVGQLRLHLPRAVAPYNGTINATNFGNQCIQQTGPPLNLPNSLPSAALQYIAVTGAVPQNVPQNEDCLNLNVIVPATVAAGSRLPVVVWIYGGGFVSGSNAESEFASRLHKIIADIPPRLPGENVVARSIELGHPVIFVSPNYRVNGFGFLPGKKMKDAGLTNIGLHDQREALRWIQKYISAFGGDPAKVMIWGQSAGAMSSALHMLHNNGDPDGLFRAAFMESGSPLPTSYVDNPLCQATFDDFVVNTGCSGSNEPITCLRNVHTDVFVQAVNKAPALSDSKQVDLPWLPRADGDFVEFPPEQQLLAGKIANIPFVAGNVLDEGTLFSFPTLNVTTDEEFLGYVAGSWFPDAPRSSIRELLKFYPSNVSAGSPFGTGNSFAYTPQYKRMAALQGDLLFVAPRRLLTQKLAGKQAVYAFLSNQHRVDGLGAPHSTDLQDVFGAPGGHLQDYLIRFAATLDPNGDGAFEWPRYTDVAPRLLTLNDAEPKLEITRDDYRKEAMGYLTRLSLAYPW
ncbi:hypothetical protein GSI_03215 [Ganoderma sinense ZZ0214-1]|uniref:Carboxylic ester hydrolase n=1 Tax=Ganoderma sinense ZZ0214-1 TaxID=1077348 RepID=A0A2G8SL05_9APHY|nr:hypothetical protein GSI_03215 [Ganoderma sinense ZZ0214-1]